MPSKVIFSERAFAAILAETYEKIATETGGVFLGIVIDDTWYVVETIDPGPNSIFQTTYFEYDRAYINHLANKINKLYSDKLSVLGLWHRHPDSMDVFSDTDNGTNKQFAEGNDGVAISAIVNVDPKFRMTVYAVTSNSHRCKEIEHDVDDYEISRANIKITSSEKIMKLINSYESQRGRGLGDLRGQYVHTTPSQQREISPNRINSLFAERIRRQRYSPDSWTGLRNTDEDFDEIVSKLYDAIEYCSKKGLPTTIEKGKGDAVNLVFGTKPRTIILSFFIVDFPRDSFVMERKENVWDFVRGSFVRKKKRITGKEVCFLFEDVLYIYDDDMFQKALEPFS